MEVLQGSAHVAVTCADTDDLDRDASLAQVFADGMFQRMRVSQRSIHTSAYRYLLEQDTN